MSARNQTRLKGISQVVFLFNLASAVFGVFYALFPAYTPIWDVFGWVIIVTIFGNLLLVFQLDRVLDKTTPEGWKLNLASYVMVLLSSLLILGMMLGNFLVSATYPDEMLQLWGRYAIVFGSYFGLFGAGMVFSFKVMRYSAANRQSQVASELVSPKGISSRRWGRALRILLIIGDGVLLAWGVYFCAITLVGAEIGVGAGNAVGAFSGIIGVAVSMWGIFWGIIMLGTALYLVKLTRRSHNKKLSWGIGILGIVVTGILFVPPVATMAYTAEADASFAGAFGADWTTRVAPAESYFLSTRFMLPEYFLGPLPKACVVIKDKVFFMNSSIELKFDAYLPPNNGQGLPGANSTLIRIHGGGWVMGDKGLGNMMQMNSYFAAQGYCVFDIQYGMNNVTKIFLSNIPFMSPAQLMGNYTVNDMVYHIGLFCKFLTAHSAEYGANLNSVFVSGGSAGGHLTCATALAIASNNYTEYFGSALTIKGYIPFYPANGVAGFLGPSDAKLIDPALLVNASSPPCLVYQGTEDGLVNPPIAQALKDAYTAHANGACAVLWMPLSGHGCDLHFSGYYNQFFLYYMERFMYLYR